MIAIVARTCLKRNCDADTAAFAFRSAFGSLAAAEATASAAVHLWPALAARRREAAAARDAAVAVTRQWTGNIPFAESSLEEQAGDVGASWHAPAGAGRSALDLPSPMRHSGAMTPPARSIPRHAASAVAAQAPRHAAHPAAALLVAGEWDEALDATLTAAARKALPCPGDAAAAAAALYRDSAVMLPPDARAYAAAALARAALYAARAVPRSHWQWLECGGPATAAAAATAASTAAHAHAKANGHARANENSNEMAKGHGHAKAIGHAGPLAETVRALSVAALLPGAPPVLARTVQRFAPRGSDAKRICASRSRSASAEEAGGTHDACVALLRSGRDTAVAAAAAAAAGDAGALTESLARATVIADATATLPSRASREAASAPLRQLCRRFPAAAALARAVGGAVEAGGSLRDAATDTRPDAAWLIAPRPASATGRGHTAAMTPPASEVAPPATAACAGPRLQAACAERCPEALWRVAGARRGETPSADRWGARLLVAAGGSCPTFPVAGVARRLQVRPPRVPHASPTCPPRVPHVTPHTAHSLPPPRSEMGRRCTPP